MLFGPGVTEIRPPIPSLRGLHDRTGLAAPRRPMVRGGLTVFAALLVDCVGSGGMDISQGFGNLSVNCWSCFFRNHRMVWVLYRQYVECPSFGTSRETWSF